MRAAIEKSLHTIMHGSFFSPPKVVPARPLLRNVTASSIANNPLVFAERPKPSEKKSEYVNRMYEKVSTTLRAPIYANHLLLMSYFTRRAGENETLKNIRPPLDAKKIEEIELGFMDRPLLPGHCLLTFINAKGVMEEEHTFSLRPNLKKGPFYQGTTAPDRRLPPCIMKANTKVWPAMHTTFRQEVEAWANTAFYTFYVHHERPHYPLHCLLKPLNQEEQKRYFFGVSDLKADCTYYSLLDHFPPNSPFGTIVTGQNCTSVVHVLERLVSSSVQLKDGLGNNPTPQLITKLARDSYFHFEEQELHAVKTAFERDELELSKPFIRS